MRQGRLKAAPDSQLAYYHCVSRVVDRAYKLIEPEVKAVFVRMMRGYELFCGVRVVTYCLMDNHFHILVEVPRRPEVMPSDEELLDLLGGVHSKMDVGGVRQLLMMFRETGADDDAERLREGYFHQMWDVSWFMKLLKQRFTQWYNRQHGRKGTLWEERFRSVLVEGAGECLAMMAAYIDLNPVRAGMVSDPKDYRWSGYAEAVAGKTAARQGLSVVVRCLKGEKGRGSAMLAVYRCWIYGVGEETGEREGGGPLKRGLNREQIAAVLAQQGRLSVWELLRCRVRYFTDGAVIGSKSFVNGVFAMNRERFGAKRKSGARRWQGSELESIYALRRLRVEPIVVSRICE